MNESLLLPIICSYGIVEWSKNILICITVQAFQSICFHIITKAPWFDLNKTFYLNLNLKIIVYKVAATYRLRF